MTYEAKVFCGTFSRNGKHFVTATQGSITSIGRYMPHDILNAFLDFIFCCR